MKQVLTDHTKPAQAMESTKLALISFTMLLGWLSLSLNTDSITDSSVAVVSKPQKADQSFATMPAPMTSLPLLTVPATSGICSSEASSSRSSTEVCGCTCGRRGVCDEQHCSCGLAALLVQPGQLLEHKSMAADELQHKN